MPSRRCLFDLAEVNGELYAIGGYDGSNYLNLNQKYTPIGYESPDSPEPEFPTMIVIVSAVILGMVAIGILAYSMKKRRT